MEPAKAERQYTTVKASREGTEARLVAAADARLCAAGVPQPRDTETCSGGIRSKAGGHQHCHSQSQRQGWQLGWAARSGPTDRRGFRPATRH